MSEEGAIYRVLGAMLFLMMLALFHMLRKTGVTWKMCFDYWSDCSCQGCEYPDRCSFGHRTTNRDEEVAMELGQVTGSNNHTGYSAVVAPRTNHHHNEDDSVDSFAMKTAEHEPLLKADGKAINHLECLIPSVADMIISGYRFSDRFER